MKPLTVTLTFSRETKSTYRYDAPPSAPVRSIYILKDAMPERPNPGFPNKIDITIAPHE